MSTICNPADLRHRAFEILVRELGYLDAVRFLLQYETGAGEYTTDRDALLPDLSDAELLRRADAAQARKRLGLRATGFSGRSRGCAERSGSTEAAPRCLG